MPGTGMSPDSSSATGPYRGHLSHTAVTRERPPIHLVRPREHRVRNVVERMGGDALGDLPRFLVTRSKRGELENNRSPERVELMKVLNQEQASILKKAGRSRKKQKRRQPFRQLRDDGRGLSVEQRRRLESQGIRPVKVGDQHVPGDVLSVELERCGHRARVEALRTGWLPQKGEMPNLAALAEHPAVDSPETRTAGTSLVVDERLEERAGRLFTVKVLGTPRRACFTASSGR